jgi:hypothetical protein
MDSFSSGSIVGMLAEQLEAANKVISTSQAIMEQLIQQGVDVSTSDSACGILTSSPQSSLLGFNIATERVASPKVAQNGCQNNGQSGGVDSTSMNLTGQWLMRDVKTRVTSVYSWRHAPGANEFSGKQLGIGGVTEGCLDGNAVSWRVGNVRCTGSIENGSRLVGGQYFGPEGKLGDFIGERQLGEEVRSPAEKAAAKRLATEKAMAIFQEQFASGKSPTVSPGVTGNGVSPMTQVDFSGLYLITSGGDGTVTITQDGSSVKAVSSSGSWTGTVSARTVRMFGITGALSEGVITWSTGMVWTRQSQQVDGVMLSQSLTEPLLSRHTSMRGTLGSPMPSPPESVYSATPRSGRKGSRDSRRRAQFSIFPDPMVLKERVAKSQYDVEKLYHTEGFFQGIAKSHQFEQVTFGMIFLNSIWIGVATDCNKADVLAEAPLWIQFFENVFCSFFTFELSVRFLSFRNKVDAIKDGWFCFDLFLVTMMAYETWVIVFIYHMVGTRGAGLGNVTVLRIFRLTRLTRLTRIARVARLLRQIPQLNILCKAMSLAMASVGATLVLLSVGIYVFSIFFVQTMAGTEEGRAQFATVPLGMHTLLVNGILAEHRELVNDLSGNAVHYIAILIYMFIVAMTMTDMLIGVISEIINSVAEVEKEAMLKENVHAMLHNIRASVDCDHSNSISKKEFAGMLDNDAVMDLVRHLDVDLVSLVNCASLIFDLDSEEKELSFEEFLEVLLGFREGAHEKKDQLEMRKFVKEEFAKMQQRMSRPA